MPEVIVIGETHTGPASKEFLIRHARDLQRRGFVLYSEMDLARMQQAIAREKEILDQTCPGAVPDRERMGWVKLAEAWPPRTHSFPAENELLHHLSSAAQRGVFHTQWDRDPKIREHQLVHETTRSKFLPFDEMNQLHLGSRILTARRPAAKTIEFSLGEERFTIRGVPDELIKGHALYDSTRTLQDVREEATVNAVMLSGQQRVVLLVGDAHLDPICARLRAIDGNVVHPMTVTRTPFPRPALSRPARQHTPDEAMLRIIKDLDTASSAATGGAPADTSAGSSPDRAALLADCAKQMKTNPGPLPEVLKALRNIYEKTSDLSKEDKANIAYNIGSLYARDGKYVTAIQWTETAGTLGCPMAKDKLTKLKAHLAGTPAGALGTTEGPGSEPALAEAAGAAGAAPANAPITVRGAPARRPPCPCVVM